MEENKETTPELPQDDHLNQETISQEETEKVINDINAATIDPRDEEIALLKKQVDEYKDKHLRLFADFDNFKKRNAKERLDLILTAGKDVIQDMLPILDDFERATKALEKTSDVDAVKEGMKLIQTKLIKTLDGKGLKAIESIGKDFNVEHHEAITEIQAAPDMAGKVIDEVEKGYYLNDKIIRFAKVVVGK
jgi:molecular chaperone GrpE